MKIISWALAVAFCIGLALLSYGILECWQVGGIITWEGCWGRG